MWTCDHISWKIKREKSREGGVNMSDKTTYESLDNRIAPEALTEDHTKGLQL